MRVPSFIIILLYCLINSINLYPQSNTLNKNKELFSLSNYNTKEANKNNVELFNLNNYSSKEINNAKAFIKDKKIPLIDNYLKIILYLNTGKFKKNVINEQEIIIPELFEDIELSTLLNNYEDHFLTYRDKFNFSFYSLFKNEYLSLNEDSNNYSVSFKGESLSEELNNLIKVYELVNTINTDSIDYNKNLFDGLKNYLLDVGKTIEALIESPLLLENIAYKESLSYAIYDLTYILSSKNYPKVKINKNIGTPTYDNIVQGNISDSKKCILVLKTSSEECENLKPVYVPIVVKYKYDQDENHKMHFVTDSLPAYAIVKQKSHEIWLEDEQGNKQSKPIKVKIDEFDEVLIHIEGSKIVKISRKLSDTYKDYNPKNRRDYNRYVNKVDNIITKFNGAVYYAQKNMVCYNK